MSEIDFMQNVVLVFLLLSHLLVHLLTMITRERKKREIAAMLREYDRLVVKGARQDLPASNRERHEEAVAAIRSRLAALLA